MASDFQLHATPNPKEFTFSVRLSQERMNNNNVINYFRQRKLERYTPYKEFAVYPQFPRVGEFGDWVYIYSTDGAPDYMDFYFARPMTDAERNTPFETINSTRSYPWPAVLEYLDFIVANPNTTSAVAFQRRVLSPSVTLSSDITIEHFLSERPWEEDEIGTDPPIPTEVVGSQVIQLGTVSSQFRFSSVNVNIGRCLHPEVRLSGPGGAGLAGSQVVQNAGTLPQTNVLAPTAGQYFPATNYTDWQPFVIEDVVQPVRGLYLREKVTIYPPTKPEAIIF